MTGVYGVRRETPARNQWGPARESHDIYVGSTRVGAIHRWSFGWSVEDADGQWLQVNGPNRLKASAVQTVLAHHQRMQDRAARQAATSVPEVTLTPWSWPAPERSAFRVTQGERNLGIVVDTPAGRWLALAPDGRIVRSPGAAAAVDDRDSAIRLLMDAAAGESAPSTRTPPATRAVRAPAMAGVYDVYAGPSARSGGGEYVGQVVRQRGSTGWEAYALPPAGEPGIRVPGGPFRTRQAAMDALALFAEEQARRRARQTPPTPTPRLRTSRVTVREPAAPTVAAPDPSMLLNRRTRPLNELIATASTQEEQAVQGIRMGVEGTYGDLRLEVDRATVARGSDGRASGLSFDASVYDATGRRVGHAEARIDRDPFTGELVAYHSYLRLEPNVRGTGFAHGLMANLFDWYRRSGVTRVRLHANIDVGGYTWATQGFEFENEAAADSFLRWARTRVEAARNAPPAGLTRQQMDELLDYIDDMLAGRRPASAPEIARFGRQEGQGGRNAIWPGKWLMLGSSWRGVLYL
jgi:GNAT superfamily N-acetyltransferase